MVLPLVVAEMEIRIGELRGWIRPSLNPRLRAILAARSAGGGLSLADIDRLWHLGLKRSRVLCLGEVPELDQMEIALARAGASVSRSALKPMPQAMRLSRFDLVVAAPTSETDAVIRQVGAEATSKLVLLDHDPRRRARYRMDRRTSAAAEPDRGASLRELLDANKKIRALLLNDMGHLFGAGIAQRRQAASLLVNGWDVAVMAWTPGRALDPPFVTGVGDFDNWHGIHALRNFPTGKIYESSWIIDRVVRKVAAFRPHVIIVGNIHGAKWPFELFPRLQQLGPLVVAYMHDCYFATGRCAYPGTCSKFLSGCDETCPTAQEYPPLEPGLIAKAWSTRADVFTGSSAVPLIANSNWTANIARKRFGSGASVEVVHLGLDEALFAPVEKATARDLLGVAQDKFVIAMGAVDIDNQWKGGPLFRKVYETLQSRPDVEIVLFGRASERYSAAKSFGLVQEERLMPLIYGAADVFVSTGTEEAFGQTLLEASACGRPVVAFNVGGVSDVVVHGQTGLLANSVSAEELISCVDRLRNSPNLIRELGRNGRARVEASFSLKRQGEAWIDCLKRLA